MNVSPLSFLRVLLGIFVVSTFSFADDHTVADPPVTSTVSGDWTTAVIYLVDPVNHVDPDEIAALREGSPYIRISSEDFNAAGEAQELRVAEENEQRIEAVQQLLQDGGADFWFPRWIPLAQAETVEDSLFANILNIQGDDQTLREYLESGYEPDGDSCDPAAHPATLGCPTSEQSEHFSSLAEQHDNGVNIISVAFNARWVLLEETDTDHSFAAELSGHPTLEVDVEDVPDRVEFDWNSVRLLKPASVNSDPNSIAPVAAGKRLGAQSASWGQIKSLY